MEIEQLKHYRHKQYLVSALMFFVIILSGCQKEKSAQTEAEVREVTIPVLTEVVHVSDFDNRLEVTAKIEPVQEATLASESSGRVLSAPFEENEQIKRNALLVRIDAVQSSSQVSLLKSQVSSAKREYERTKKLAAEGLATPQQVDQLFSQVEQAELSLSQAKIGLSKSVLRAPISGYVVNKYVQTGEFVGAGAPVARIIDYNTVKILASVPESEIRHINQDDSVEVYIPSLEKTFTGKVYRRSVMAHEESRTFDVDIRIENKNLEILPGMRAKVLIPRDILKNVVVVDQSAILQGFDNEEAMVLPGTKPIGTAETRVVKTGPTKGTKVVVLEGLNDGDRLIVRGHRGIVNGTLVEDHTEVIKNIKQPSAQPKEGAANDNRDGSDEQANAKGGVQ